MARKQPTPATSFQQASETVTEYKCESLAATEIGDLIVCNLLVFSTGRTYTATGWTQRGSTASITGGQWATFTRIATEAGKKSYPIKISGTAISGTWACTYVRGCDQTTPVVGAETKVSTASTTVKWASVTPSPAGQMDFLLVMSVEEDTFTTPAGFTAQATGTSLHHSFSREYTKSEVTGETSTTQSKSTPYGSTRLILQGEEEAGGKTVEGSASLSGTGSLTAVPQRIVFGKASLAGTGTLASSSVASHYGKASLAGTGSLSASGRRTALGSALLSGVGSLSAKATQTTMGKAALSGLGSLTANAVRSRFGQALLTGLGSLVANGTTEHKSTSGLPRRPYGRRYKIHNPPE